MLYGQSLPNLRRVVTPPASWKVRCMAWNSSSSGMGPWSWGTRPAAATNSFQVSKCSRTCQSPIPVSRLKADLETVSRSSFAAKSFIVRRSALFPGI